MQNKIMHKVIDLLRMSVLLDMTMQLEGAGFECRHQSQEILQKLKSISYTIPIMF
jgi:hypothetical protein